MALDREAEADEIADRVPDRLLASALEFAIGIAAAGAKLRPPLPYPAELKPFLKFTKLPPKAWRDVRRVVEADPMFLRRLGSVAVPELLDEAGMLWLTRPDDWIERLNALAGTDDEQISLDGQAELRRAERRRVAAEQATSRMAAELASARTEVERVTKLRSEAEIEVTELRRERDAARAEAAAHQAELRRAVDRLTTAQARLEAQRLEATAAAQRADEAERLRDQLLADRAAPPDVVPDGGAQIVLAGATQVADDLAKLVQQSRTMATELGRLAGRLQALEPAVPAPAEPPSAVPAKRRGHRSARRPVALPGGIYGSSSAAAEFLVRHPGMVVLVDGYNVAKLGWPRLELDEQRERCIESAEDIARRHGANIAIVFDGTTVAGAAATGRRLVRVAFSPEGVIADDVLRAEVEAMPDDVPALVVTNDQAVLADVRAMGANILSSNQWLELARR